MSSFIEKIFGYGLFFVGLICIAFAFFSMYNVFSDVAKPPEIFKMKTLSFATPDATGQSKSVTIVVNAEMRKIVNMAIYYLLMFFVVIVGGKIASLGIQMIKEIKVKMKN